MKSFLTVCCVASSLLLLGAVPVRADTIVLQFSGTMTDVPVDQVFGDIALGEAFHGTLSFDSTSVDQAPDDATVGIYSFSAPFGMEITIGAHDFEAFGSLNLEIVNSFVDQYTVLATSQDGRLSVNMFLLDNTGAALDDDHLGLSMLAKFGERDFQLDDFLGAGELQVTGAIDASFIQQVPEPSQVVPTAMMALVAATLAYRRRSRLRSLSSKRFPPR